MRRLPPRSTRAATLLPYTTLFRSIASALLAEAGIVAPGVVGERNHAELHRKLAEVPVRAAPHDLAVAIKLGGGAERVARLARRGSADAHIVMRGLHEPPNIADRLRCGQGRE